MELEIIYSDRKRKRIAEMITRVQQEYTGNPKEITTDRSDIEEKMKRRDENISRLNRILNKLEKDK